MEDLQMQYDSLCYATMVNVMTNTKGADRIVFRNFDYNNKEHLFVMSVTMACWNLLGEREVAIDDGMFARRALSKRYKKICKIGKAGDDEKIFIDIPEMLEFMRGPACQMCGDSFTFGDIYDKYYSGKGI